MPGPLACWLTKHSKAAQQGAEQYGPDQHGGPGADHVTEYLAPGPCARNGHVSQLSAMFRVYVPCVCTVFRARSPHCQDHQPLPTQAIPED